MDSLHDRSSMMHSQWMSKLELWQNSLRDWVWVRKNDILRTKIFLQSSLRFWPEWSGCDGNFSWPLDHLHIPVHAATLLGPIKSQLMKAEVCFNFQTFSTIFFTSPSYDINLHSPVFKSSITTSIGFHQLVSFASTGCRRKDVHQQLVECKGWVNGQALAGPIKSISNFSLSEAKPVGRCFQLIAIPNGGVLSLGSIMKHKKVSAHSFSLPWLWCKTLDKSITIWHDSG